MDFTLANEDKVESVAQLNKKFRKFHMLTRSQRVGTKKLSSDPIVLVLNPPQYNSQFEDKWFAVYYRNFFVTIEKGSSTMFGPHVARLFYQVCRGNTVWVGTAQLRGNFFSRKNIRKKLRIAILKKKYYISPKEGEEIVYLDSLGTYLFAGTV